MSRVFLASKVMSQEVREELDKAAKFGDIVFLASHLPYYNPQAAIEQLTEEVTKQRFDPLRDFVCLAGNIVANAMLIAVIARMHPKFSTLVFDSRAGVRNYQAQLFNFEVQNEPAAQ